MTADNGLLENRFYRVRFDAATGAITSIFDKQLKVELVDQAAPHKFNEYLYERYRDAQGQGRLEMVSGAVGRPARLGRPGFGPDDRESVGRRERRRSSKASSFTTT